MRPACIDAANRKMGPPKISKLPAGVMQPICAVLTASKLGSEIRLDGWTVLRSRCRVVVQGSLQITFIPKARDHLLLRLAQIRLRRFSTAYHACDNGALTAQRWRSPLHRDSRRSHICRRSMPDAIASATAESSRSANFSFAAAGVGCICFLFEKIIMGVPLGFGFAVQVLTARSPTLSKSAASFCVNA